MTPAQHIDRPIVWSRQRNGFGRSLQPPQVTQRQSPDNTDGERLTKAIQVDTFRKTNLFDNEFQPRKPFESYGSFVLSEHAFADKPGKH
jgi:hypothetical protein